MKNDKFVKDTGIKIHFAIDDENEVLAWDSGINFIKKHYFVFNGIKGGNILIKMFCKIINFIPSVRRLYKILVYKIK